MHVSTAGEGGWSRIFIFNFFQNEASDTCKIFQFSISTQVQPVCKIIVKLKLTFDERQGFCLYILLSFSWQVNFKISHVLTCSYCSLCITYLTSSVLPDPVYMLFDEMSLLTMYLVVKVISNCCKTLYPLTSISVPTSSWTSTSWWPSTVYGPPLD